MRLQSGERGLLIGRTGSGKTGHALWQMRYTDLSPVIVLDTKISRVFHKLPGEGGGGEREGLRVVEGLADFSRLTLDEVPEYLLVRPLAVELADAEALDAYLQKIYESLAPAFVYLDEATHFQARGSAGPGLINLLTRGREKGLTVLMGVQRPRFISGFLISEADRFYIYQLNQLPDRQRVAEFVPDFASLPPLPDFNFYYYSPRMTAARASLPVPEISAAPTTKPGAGSPWI